MQMLGIIIAIISGISMSLQGVFNTRLSETVGLWETNVIVQIIGLIFTFIVMLLAGDGNIRAIKDANKLYLLGGIFRCCYYIHSNEKYINIRNYFCYRNYFNCSVIFSGTYRPFWLV